MKKITIYIISYNQENVISRALDSVLQQKEWGLYRLIVSDDCSKDRTWEILQEYKEKYPNIVYIYRNDNNLGIYKNLSRVITLLPESDLYGSLAGDDEYCDGYFESIQKLIEEKHIDTRLAVGIYSDWKLVYPNSKEAVFKQSAVLSGHRLWSLKARGIISGRSLLTTKRVRDKYEPMLQGKGLNLTESHFDSQPHLNIEYPYYLPQVTSVYYGGIGVSARLIKNSDYLTTQSIEKWKYGVEHYVKTQEDLYFAKYELLKAEYYMHPSISAYMKLFYYFYKGQLRNCRIPLKRIIRMFLGLAKYGVLYTKK